MFYVLVILLIYGVDTESVQCPEGCACLKILASKFNVLSDSTVFDDRNYTEWSGLNDDFNSHKIALINSIENNQVKTISSDNVTFRDGSNKTASTMATATPSQGASYSGSSASGKKCSKPPKENVKDSFVNNFSPKAANGSKALRTKRTLKLNVNLIPRFSDSAMGPDEDGMTKGDPDDENNKWETSEAEGKKSENVGEVSTYRITCDQVRDLKSLRLRYLPGGTVSRLIIRKTYFPSFRLFLQVLRESPINFNRLAVLSITNNVINQDPNDGNSKTDSTREKKSEDFQGKNHGAGKSRSENGEKFLPFASLQNPKPRLAKPAETAELQSSREKFKSVRVLDLADNKIPFLPQDTFQPFQYVEILNLSSNMIDTIDNKTFAPLTNLLQLDLSKNNLSVLSEEIFVNLSKLLFLDVSDNFIGNVAPSTFQYLTSLVLLNLASNKLSQKEESVAFLLGTGKRLQIVDVSKTGLKQIPGTLERSVRVLNLMENHLPSIRCGDLDSYSLLSYLNLRKNKISYVEDDALGRLELLVNLQIGENNLFQVPKSLPNNLEILNLSYNNIQSITYFDFLNLSLLKELSVSYNQIASIEAKALDHLIHLRVLDLSHNPILIVPNVYGLGKLTRLNLSYFTNIPGNSSSFGYKQFPIQSPENIRELNLQFSPLLTAVFLQDTKILESFNELENLDVRFSNLTTMRKDIFSLLPKLRILKLEGNPWHCGREILILSEWLKENAVEKESDMSAAHCSTPPYLYKTSLIALNEKNFERSEEEKKQRSEKSERNFVEVKEMKNSSLGENNSEIPGSKESEILSGNMKNFTKFSLEMKNDLFANNQSEIKRKIHGKKYSKSVVKVKTVVNQKAGENIAKENGGSVSKSFAIEKPEAHWNLKNDSTNTSTPASKRNITEEGTSGFTTQEVSSDQKNVREDGRIVIGWNDNTTDLGIPVKNYLDLQTTPGIFRQGTGRGNAEAIAAQNPLSLPKEYNSHLSFFVLSSIGLFAMATLTFTSVYFSRARREQTYQRQIQEMEISSISNAGNELW